MDSVLRSTDPIRLHHSKGQVHLEATATGRVDLMPGEALKLAEEIKVRASNASRWEWEDDDEPLTAGPTKEGPKEVGFPETPDGFSLVEGVR